MPPKPYTPLINSISVSYTSIKEMRQGEDQFFHILPFGTAQISVPNPSGNVYPPPGAGSTIFPGWLRFPGTGEQNAGMLFIGIENLVANQNIHLLFQVDQGSKRSDKHPPDASWFYLKNNDWIPLKNDFIISDSTYGLQTTGIIELAVPNDINNGSTMFNKPDLYWICAAVAEDIDAFPNLTAIDAQAITVTFQDNTNDPLHLAFPHPAGKINRLADPVPAIKSVQQPVASFNGKIEESENAFYTRVSERLRHKGRAINNWDYERLILENFPDIFKVKCINNYYNGQFLPGHVTVVPIVNLKNKYADLRSVAIPKASYLQLRNMEVFLQQKASSFIKIHAINPGIDYLKVNCSIQLYTGVDKGFYLNKLNEDLMLFLTPWADDGSKLSFSAKIYASSVVSFIDSRDYVDFVADLSINQFSIKEDGSYEYYRLENRTISLTETQISSPHSILVSAEAHNIQLL